jgi:hypothetical protein
MDHPLLLIADNDEDDLFLLQRAMTRLRILNPCEEVRTGEEVKDYFKRTERSANRIAYPQAVGVILLLDAHLPTISGVEVVMDTAEPATRVDGSPRMFGLFWNPRRPYFCSTVTLAILPVKALGSPGL